jgi:hypothetical protein
MLKQSYREHKLSRITHASVVFLCHRFAPRTWLAELCDGSFVRIVFLALLQLEFSAGSARMGIGMDQAERVPVITSTLST